MKKKIIIFIILILLVCVVFGIILNNKKIKIKDDLNINNISNNLENVIKNQSSYEYIDKNQMKIGLYIDEGSTKRLVNKYYCDFTAENVMGIFYAIPTTEEIVNGKDFKGIFDTYYNI